MRATLKQIAERSGLSIPTVSRILSDKGNVHQEATRERVLQAASALGYRPNASARSMRSGKFDSIALLQSATDSGRSLLPMELLAGIQEAIAEHALHLSIASLPDTCLTDETYLPKILREWATDGLLINYNALIPDAMQRLIAEYTIPAIWINSQQKADCVFPDDEGAIALGVRHLLQLGHTKIAYADFQQSVHYSALARRTGYERTMHEAGLTPRYIIGHLMGDFHTIPVQIDRFLEGDWPTSFLTYGPETMRSLLIGAVCRSKRIPQDLSLISVATHPGECLHLPVDTLILPEEAIGRQAVAMLLKKISEPEGLIAPVAVPFRLESGYTTAPPSCP